MTASTSIKRTLLNTFVFLTNRFVAHCSYANNADTLRLSEAVSEAKTCQFDEKREISNLFATMMSILQDSK